MKAVKGKYGAGRISRRKFVVAASAAATLVGVPTILSRPARASQFKGKSIRVLSWTDESGQAAVRNIMRPFEAETGCKVIQDLTGRTAEMVAKIKASAANPQHDVITISMVGAIELANAGLLQKPNANKLPNLSRVIPGLETGANGFGVGYYLWSEGLTYNTDVFPAAPSSWKVLWDEKHAGKLALPNPAGSPIMNLTVMAAKMAGGDERNPEPGFQLLSKLKGRVLLLEGNPARVVDLIRTGAVHLWGPTSPMMMTAFMSKPEYKTSLTLNCDEGFFYDLQVMVIPKSHPGDDDAAHAFINYALDPKVQGRMAEDVYYGVINRDAVLSEKLRQSPFILSPARIKEKGITLDIDYLATVRQEWIRRVKEIFAA